MVVLTLILIFASFSIPILHSVVVRAREAELRDHLYTMRWTIDRFTFDNKRPPETLDELVEKGYLGNVPVDPFTGSDQTWQTDTEDFPFPDTDPSVGIVDVHSGSDQVSLEGTPYNTW